MSGEKIYFACGCVFVLAVAGCGGRQAPPPSPCEDGYNLIMEKGDDGLCETLQMNLFEIQVTKWKDDCPVEAESPQGTKANEKLEKARVCSEKTRRTEILQNECRSRLAKAWTESDSCIGESCAPFLKALDDIVATCNGAEMGEDFADETGSLKANLDERMTDVERLTALAALAALADEITAPADAKQAAAAVDKILKAVSESTFVKETPKIGSEAERHRQKATTALDTALQSALNRMIAGFAGILDNSKIKPTARKWKRELGKLTALRARLQEADGGSLFPESLALMETTVEKYVPTEKPAAAATASAEAASAKTASTQAPQVTTASTAAAPTAAAASRPKTPAQCKALEKKAAQFSAKVAEYQKKENVAKLNAYQSKLDRVNLDLAVCGEAAAPVNATATAPVEKTETADVEKSVQAAEPTEKTGTAPAPKVEESEKAPASPAAAEKKQPTAAPKAEEKPTAEASK